MWKRILALSFIFICTSAAWVFLGGVTRLRTFAQDVKLKKTVGQLWGTIQKQQAPEVYYQTTAEVERKRVLGNETVVETVKETSDHPVVLDSSDITVTLDLEHRKKGLLWYSTYNVSFVGKYTVKNAADEKRDYHFAYTFPTKEGIYDDFRFTVDGQKVDNLQPASGKLVQLINLEAGQEKNIEVSYTSQGMDQWWYLFGSDVSRIQNFKLTMLTDFEDIDFPENGISPKKKVRRGDGWELTWDYTNLISGIQIGMIMPQKLNPGPFVSEVSFFAPVSLFFFLFLMFIITVVKKVNIHPMNYFFISASFFSFHLLFAYLVDHIDVHVAFLICSAVSIFLVISYMRLVAGLRFALLETGLSQLVYLVLFSYSFFLEGYTGLAITIASILTLFIVMQCTGRIDWARQFAGASATGKRDEPRAPA